MTTVSTSAPPSRRSSDSLTRVGALASRPVPTFVCRAADDRLVVLEHLSNDERPTLNRDAATLPALQHPNLARVRQITASPRGIVLVSDYIPGESLSELEQLARAAAIPIPLEVKLRIFVDVLSGLSALHGHLDESGRPAGLVHRHLDAKNVIVGLDGITRLVHLTLTAASPHKQRDRSRTSDANLPPDVTTGVDLLAAGSLLDHLLSGGLTSETAWAAPLSRIAKRATWPVADAGFATAAAMAAEVRLIAKAKLATPVVVAALVDDVVGSRIQARIRRLTTAKTSTLAPPATSPRVGSTPDRVSVVPRKPAPPLPAPRQTEFQSAVRAIASPVVAAPAAISAPVAVAHVTVPTPFAIPITVATPITVASPVAPPVPASPPLKSISSTPPAPHVVDVRIPAPPSISMVAPTSSAAVEVAADVDELPMAVEHERFAPAEAPFQTRKSRRRLTRIVAGVVVAATAILAVAGLRRVGGANGGSLAQETSALAPLAPVSSRPAVSLPEPAAQPTSQATAAKEVPSPVTKAPEQASPAPPVPVTPDLSTTTTTTKKPRRTHDAPHTAKPAATYDPLGI